MRHVTICKHDVINLISARYVSSINILVRERLCVIDFFFLLCMLLQRKFMELINRPCRGFLQYTFEESSNMNTGRMVVSMLFC
jgi:hypothetical protein